MDDPKESEKVCGEAMQVIEEFPGHNTIEISDAIRANVDGAIQINGKNNVVSIGMPAHSAGFYISMCGDSHLQIGEGNWFNRQEFYLVAPGKLSIGEGCAWSGPVVVTMHESANIDIGAHCLIAGGARISTSHVHKIYDRFTGERLNGPRDVKIGDKVWICADASIFPGADIGHDSVVGIGAYVSKRFEPHCLIAGAPAKVIRENIIWKP